MEKLSINLADYGYAAQQDGFHFGIGSSENVDALNKALAAEHPVSYTHLKGGCRYR